MQKYNLEGNLIKLIPKLLNGGSENKKMDRLI